MNSLKVTNSTKLNYLQSKIYLLRQLQMTDEEYSKKVMQVGEVFVNTFCDRDAELQMRILTDERLGFWSAFRYEWFRHDIIVVRDFFYRGIPLDVEVYRHLKANYLTANATVINNIIYKVQKNLKKYE